MWLSLCIFRYRVRARYRSGSEPAARRQCRRHCRSSGDRSYSPTPGVRINRFGIFPESRSFEQNEHMPCKLDIALCVRMDAVVRQKLGVVRNDRACVEYNDIVVLCGEIIEHSVYMRNRLDKRNMSEALPRAVDIVRYQRCIGIYLADERIDSIQIVIDAVGYLVKLLVVCSNSAPMVIQTTSLLAR